MLRVLVIILFAGTGYSQEIYRVTINPMDIDSAEHNLFLPGLNQIESDNNRLFISSNKSTQIMVLNRNGKLLRTIGEEGDHPAGFGFGGVLCFSVQGQKIWGIDLGVQRARLFENKTYTTGFKLDSFNTTRVSAAANLFAFSEEFVVIPTNRDPEHLAALYLHDGTLVDHIGEPIELSQMVHEKVLGMNETHWRRHGDGWLSVHKHFPLITVYGPNFEMIDRFQLMTPHISNQLDLIKAADPGDRYGIPTPVFSDFKVFRDDLYLISQGHFMQVDLETHEIKSITTFRGEGPDFAEVDAPNLNLFYFAFLNDGKLVLGHPALLWNHDLWTANLPYLQQAQN